MDSRLRIGLAAAVSIGASLVLLPAAFAQYDAAPRVDLTSERSTPAPVTLPRSVVEAAGAYEAYQRKAAAIRADFHDGEAINRAMTVGETYQPAQMQEGLIAYAAMIALEDPAFVNGVRATTGGPEGAEREADALLSYPASVTAIPGSGEAVALAGAVLREEGSQLLAAGQAVKQSAYDVQREGWSRQTAPDSAGRLARAKSLSASTVIPAPEEVSALLQTAAAFQGRRATGEPTLTPTLERGLTLAALAVLGQADDERRLSVLWARPETASCMKMAKLNLYQCLAVAGPHYEDIFCLGQHAMMDTGQCIASFGGQAQISQGLSTARADRGAIEIPVADNDPRR
ncbi:MAG TPA: hypothetical protein VHY32_10355 [Caulobacteraceae bacterium]|nr:hypothetical protein [Caulobacteraceae bacterium]